MDTSPPELRTTTCLISVANSVANLPTQQAHLETFSR